MKLYLVEIGHAYDTPSEHHLFLFESRARRFMRERAPTHEWEYDFDADGSICAQRCFDYVSLEPIKLRLR